MFDKYGEAGPSFEEFLQLAKLPTSGPNVDELNQKAYGEFLNNYRSQYVQNRVSSREKELTDFNSDYYKQFGNYLQKYTPKIGVNSLLAPLAAGGFDYGGAQKIAAERGKQLNQDRNQNISKSVQEFALGSQGQAGSLLGMLLNNSQFQQKLAEQKRQFDESQPTFWDSLGNIAGGILGLGVGNLFSGKSFFGGSGNSGGGSGNSGVNGYGTGWGG